ncbi:glycosyltransferase [Nocardia sp. NPDC004722]
MLISVVTPCYRTPAHFLDDAYRSLRDQVLPAGWAWEWLVQADGDEPLPLPPRALADPRVRPASGPRGGPGTTRNLALERSCGALIRNLDSDDVLTPHALADSIGVLTADPEIGWTTSRALDWMPDGSLREFATDPPPGRIHRGAVHAWWLDHGYRLNVHPATICVRRELLIAVGGWMALPSSEDTGMLLAVSTLRDGWFLPRVGLHYRKHPGQLTEGAQYAVDRTARAELLAERVRALESDIAPTRSAGEQSHSGRRERWGDSPTLGE